MGATKLCWVLLCERSMIIRPVSLCVWTASESLRSSTDLHCHCPPPMFPHCSHPAECLLICASVFVKCRTRMGFLMNESRRFESSGRVSNLAEGGFSAFANQMNIKEIFPSHSDRPLWFTRLSSILHLWGSCQVWSDEYEWLWLFYIRSLLWSFTSSYSHFAAVLYLQFFSHCEQDSILPGSNSWPWKQQLTKNQIKVFL